MAKVKDKCKFTTSKAVTYEDASSREYKDDAVYTEVVCNNPECNYYGYNCPMRYINEFVCAYASV